MPFVPPAAAPAPVPEVRFVLVLDSLRSWMGQGALAFTAGQRLMVFSTDERLAHPPGQFTPLDCWTMGRCCA